MENLYFSGRFLENKVKIGDYQMFRYDGLEAALRKKGKQKTDLCRDLGLSSRTVAKIAKGEKLSTQTLQKLAAYLGETPESLYTIVSDNHILQILREEKEIRLPGGLYHELQVRMAYNSNHIEGSRLSEEQTRMIFETNMVDAGDGVSVDDILETVHHFQAVDYIIDCAEDKLTEEMIKHLHYILKHDTADSRLAWFAVGEYKQRENVVGGRETAKPSEVHLKMKELLAEYHAKPVIAIEDIIAFHARFEQIHPFQDGNGRVGRLIALKECLGHNVIPFLIEDSKKPYYYRGLREWGHENGWLTDTCLDGQDTFKELLDMFGIHRETE